MANLTAHPSTSWSQQHWSSLLIRLPLNRFRYKAPPMALFCNCRRSLLAAALLFYAAQASSQQNWRAEAGIVLGWVPGGGLRWGIECAAHPLHSATANPKPGLGGALFWSRLHYGRASTHRSVQLFASLPMERHTARIGVGSLSHRWGYSGVNRCRVPALMLDYRYKLAKETPFYAGSNLLLYQRQNYRFYDKPVWSLNALALMHSNL